MSGQDSCLHSSLQFHHHSLLLLFSAVLSLLLRPCKSSRNWHSKTTPSWPQSSHKFYALPMVYLPFSEHSMQVPLLTQKCLSSRIPELLQSWSPTTFPSSLTWSALSLWTATGTTGPPQDCAYCTWVHISTILCMGNTKGVPLGPCCMCPSGCLTEVLFCF